MLMACIQRRANKRILALCQSLYFGSALKTCPHFRSTGDTKMHVLCFDAPLGAVQQNKACSYLLVTDAQAHGFLSLHILDSRQVPPSHDVYTQFANASAPVDDIKKLFVKEDDTAAVTIQKHCIVAG